MGAWSPFPPGQGDKNINIPLHPKFLDDGQVKNLPLPGLMGRIQQITHLNQANLK
jgi:hypothetical protein